MRRFPFLFAATPFFAAFLLAQPTPPSARQLEQLRGTSAFARPAATVPLTVDPSSREEVRQFYRAVYGASDGVAMNWTGDYTTGAAGDTASAFKQAVLLRINFFRALVGVPATVTLNSTFNTKDQQAALMMSANSSLSHTPPSSWTFYTAAGAEAAGNSNLAIGSAGAEAITGYMLDSGSNNAAVGHRRWLFYPQTREMGTGDVPGSTTLYAANATWVIDSNYGGPRPATRTTAVPYPPAGYVPYTLIFPRWSFTYPGADFSNATVTMTRGGQNVPVQLEPLTPGAGEPTLVWAYDGIAPDAETPHAKPAADVAYTVNVNNVQISGASQNFNYNVTVFDPDATGADFVPVSVSGTSSPAVGAANAYAVTKPSFAGSFDWRTLQFAAFGKTYGAESGFDGIAATTADYDVVEGGIVGAGSAAYHLAHPTRTSQILLLPEIFYVNSATAAVTFLSRLAVASPIQVARVQASTDDGVSWTDLFSQAGADNEGAETAFTQRTASLAAFNGKTVRVRFNFTVNTNGVAYPQISDGVGWYVDNITLSGVQNATASAPTNVAGASTFSFTPANAGAIGLQARGVLFGAYPLEWGPVAQVTAAVPPTITTQPASHAVEAGSSTTLTFAATGATSVHWQRDGVDLAGGTASGFTLNNVQPDTAGLYVAVASNSAASVSSNAAIVGVSTNQAVIGAGQIVGTDITHPNGNHFDQVLVTGAAESISNANGRITRTSFIDLDDDIVQVEFAGPGTLTVVFENASAPAAPVNYNQPAAAYVKGHAGIVISDATEQTNVSVFSVGRATAYDPTGAYNILLAPSATNDPAKNGSSLFVGHETTAYDGIADIAFIAIASKNGKFGGVRTSNANFFAAKGLTGVYAPGVAFQGPVFIGDIIASDAATPVIVLGSASDTRITGGDMMQSNGHAVVVSGITQLKFTPGSDSHGNTLAAQASQAAYQENGTDVTSQIVVNP